MHHNNFLEDNVVFLLELDFYCWAGDPDNEDLFFCISSFENQPSLCDSLFESVNTF